MSLCSFEFHKEEEGWDQYFGCEEVPYIEHWSSCSMAALLRSHRGQSSGSGEPRDISTAALPPTDEQIRQAGGFQTPSLTSTTELCTRSNGGFMSRSSPSDISKTELPRPGFVRSEMVSALLPNDPFVPICPDNKFDKPQLSMKSSSILGEPRPTVQDNENPSKEISGKMLQDDDDWVTEVSWSEGDIHQAIELEQQVDAAYVAQMAALRTCDWVGYTRDLRLSATPPGQIRPWGVGKDECGQDSGFSGFSGSISRLNGVGTWMDEGRPQNPFITSPNKSSLPPQAEYVLPDTRPFVPRSSPARRARWRNRQLSPCAYRSRTEADLLLNALQYEVSMNEKCHRRSSEPEAESEHLACLFKTSDTDGSRHDIAAKPDISRSLNLNAILSQFDLTTSKILEDVKAANERFFSHIKAFLGRKACDR